MFVGFAIGFELGVFDGERVHGIPPYDSRFTNPGK